MFEDDSDLDSASKQCKESVVAAVAVDMNGEAMSDHIGIEEMVRKGFCWNGWRVTAAVVLKVVASVASMPILSIFSVIVPTGLTQNSVLLLVSLFSKELLKWAVVKSEANS